MSEARPKQVVERYLAGVLNGTDPGSAAALIANETLRRRVERFRAAFPDLRVGTRTVVEDREHVALHLAGHGTHLGVWQGCPPTGREWTATCTAIYRVDAGRIAEAWINWDTLAVMEQLGCVERTAAVSA